MEVSFISVCTEITELNGCVVKPSFLHTGAQQLRTQLCKEVAAVLTRIIRRVRTSPIRQKPASAHNGERKEYATVLRRAQFLLAPFSNPNSHSSLRRDR